ncbi:unnamed protein product [marine sediment metagenome]|uniref:Uncharacterized protein n=1 Tax=marine sediment metagenome TaxID=412755 RepID=X1BQW7_9ZZZZ
MIIRGIPLLILLVFIIFILLELSKRYIPNKEWHDFIPAILVFFALLYGSVCAYYFNLDFGTSFQEALTLLAPAGLFKFLQLIAPSFMSEFERKPIE